MGNLVNSIHAASFQDLLPSVISAWESRKKTHILMNILRLKIQVQSHMAVGAEFERHSMEIWHDRAAFHFLTGEDDRASNVRQVLDAIKPGVHVIMATLGANGPLQCTGLPVIGHAPDSLHAEFGEAFTTLSHEEQLHHTPFGTAQQFIDCMYRKIAIWARSAATFLVRARTALLLLACPGPLVRSCPS